MSLLLKNTWGLKKGTGASGLEFSFLAAGLCFFTIFYFIFTFFASPLFFIVLILPLFISSLGYPWSFP
ncbi:hypothetical protein HDV64DRAFT_201373 [Trichoderma sp. TUCIM 5745]